MSKEEPKQRKKLQDLLKELFKSHFVKLGLKAWAVGLVVLVAAEMSVGQVRPELLWLLHLFRDVGIALIVAGTVGIGAEFATRKEGMDLLQMAVGEALENTVEPKLDRLESLIHSDRFKLLGIRDVYPDRSEHRCQEYLKEAPAGGVIRLLGISMGYLASKEVRSEIRTKLNAGCRFKLLLLKRESAFFAKRALEEARQLESTPDEENDAIEAFERDAELWSSAYKNFYKKLPQNLSRRFQMRYYDAPPGYLLIDNGVRMLVGIYVLGCSGDKCPHFELLKGGAAYEKFSNHFDLLWKWTDEAMPAQTAKDGVAAPTSFQERRKESKRVPVERRSQQSSEVA
jgi:hypothetical protein